MSPTAHLLHPLRMKSSEHNGAHTEQISTGPELLSAIILQLSLTSRNKRTALLQQYARNRL